jgi:hypothetical protein
MLLFGLAHGALVMIALPGEEAEEPRGGGDQGDQADEDDLVFLVFGQFFHGANQNSLLATLTPGLAADLGGA